jgi:uncharacterized membrane protein YgcG
VAGGIASGRVPAGGRAGDPVDSWVNPTSVVAGVLALALFAYLAAAYLVRDARAAGEEDLAEHFRQRCVLSAVVVAAVLVVGAFVVRSDAPYVWDGLTSRALPVVAVSALCGAGALVLLLRDAARGARVLAAVGLPAAREPDRRRRRSAVGHPDRPGRGGGSRARPGPPRVPAALPPRPARDAARGGLSRPLRRADESVGAGLAGGRGRRGRRARRPRVGTARGGGGARGRARR